MKKLKRITASFLLVASILVTAMPFSVGVSAAALVYSKDSNSGTRHVVCTTLEGTSASKYYTGSYTYENLEKLSPTALFDALQVLMTVTHTKTSSYDDCLNMANKTDCENNDGRINLIYSSRSVTLDDYNSVNGWSREHVWPKSLGADTTNGGGADLHHIRSSDNGLNSKISNLKYGNVSDGTAVTGGSLVGSFFVGGYKNSTYFEPLDNVKGDIARICLYMYVRWETGWECTSITKVFESVDVLLEWCALDPVDTWEMGRNEVVAAYQGNRNVFIDYPELAWLIFDRDIPEGMTTPSGNASSGDPSCPHTATEVKNAFSAICGDDGYTGDTYCVSCGKKMSSGTTVIATVDHEYGSWENSETQHWKECAVCKKTNEVDSHSYDNSCDTDCNICEYTRRITHSYGTVWEKNDTQHWHICSVCSASEPKSDHVYYNACDTTCNSCGYVRTITHSYRTVWSSDETEHWRPCSVCGLSDEKISHVFENAQDERCDICGYTRQVVTTPTTTSKPPVTAPSTTVPSTTPDATTAPTSSTTIGDETTSDVTDGQENNDGNGDTKLIALCVFSALGGALICGTAVAVVFKKKK